LEKTEADLAWDRMRREVEYKLNLASAHWKAEMKNRILPALQEEFETQLNQGIILALEETTGKPALTWINELVEELGA